MSALTWEELGLDKVVAAVEKHARGRFAEKLVNYLTTLAEKSESSEVLIALNDIAQFALKESK